MNIIGLKVLSFTTETSAQRLSPDTGVDNVIEGLATNTLDWLAGSQLSDGSVYGVTLDVGHNAIIITLLMIFFGWRTQIWVGKRHFSKIRNNNTQPKGIRLLYALEE